MDRVVAKLISLYNRATSTRKCIYIACKSGGYLPVSGGQLALVMAEVTTTNHCGKNTGL